MKRTRSKGFKGNRINARAREIRDPIHAPFIRARTRSSSAPGGTNYGLGRTPPGPAQFTQDFTTELNIDGWNTDHRDSQATGVTAAGAVFEVDNDVPVFPGIT